MSTFCSTSPCKEDKDTITGTSTNCSVCGTLSPWSLRERRDEDGISGMRISSCRHTSTSWFSICGIGTSSDRTMNMLSTICSTVRRWSRSCGLTSHHAGLFFVEAEELQLGSVGRWGGGREPDFLGLLGRPGIMDRIGFGNLNPSCDAKEKKKQQKKKTHVMKNSNRKIKKRKTQKKTNTTIINNNKIIILIMIVNKPFPLLGLGLALPSWGWGWPFLLGWPFPLSGLGLALSEGWPFLLAVGVGPSGFQSFN